MQRNSSAALFAEMPESLLREAIAEVLEVCPAEEDAAHAQRVAERAIIALIERQRAAPIVVSEQRDGAVGAREVHQHLKHRLDLGGDYTR